MSTQTGPSHDGQRLRLLIGLAALLAVVLALAWALWPRTTPGRSTHTSMEVATDSSVGIVATPSLEGAPRSVGPILPSPPSDADAVAAGDTGLRWRGIVRDAESGAPLEDAMVFPGRETARLVAFAHMAKTTALGTFDLVVSDAELPSPDRLFVMRPEYLPAEVPLGGLVAPGPLDIEMQRGESLHGRVETSAGSPLEGATVTAAAVWNPVGWPHSEYAWIGMGSAGAVATTDSAGRFELRGLAPDQEYDVRATKPGYGQRALAHERLAPPHPDVTLTLVPEARVVFVDGRNEPASKVQPGHVWLTSLMIRPGPRLTSVGSTYWSTGMVGEERFLVEGPSQPGEEIPFDYYWHTHDGGMRKGEAIARVGATTIEHLEPTPLDDEPRHLVSIRAIGMSATSFSGWLQIALNREGVRGESVIRMKFEGGMSVDRLALRAGSYSVAGVRGGDLHTAFWRGFDKQVFDVPAAQEVHLPLAGAPYDLTVRAVGGSPVRGYMLEQKSPSGRSSGWFHDRLPSTGPTPSDHVRVWLDPGVNTLTAGLAGLGTGSIQVAASGSSEPTKIEIVLDPERPFVDPWEAVHRKAKR